MTKADTANALNSMTGFARTSGVWAREAWAWELKSVNGKALDMRFRLPAGSEGIEASARTLVSQRIKRGNLQINLTVSGTELQSSPKVNRVLLDQLAALAANMRSQLGGGAVDVEQLLQIRGVLEFPESTPEEGEIKVREQALLDGLAKAVDGLAASRATEGRKLKQVLEEQLVRIKALTIAAKDSPVRSVELQRKRLAELVAKLMDANGALDPQRLHQEAALLHAKADVQEELDRLFAHIELARSLLMSGDAVGRKLDFLMQEFNREANTLCSKSPDASLTAIGLDLKTVIDQMREQVQNIE
jgi:uncharacterized protein (TIGR00255 family)